MNRKIRAALRILFCRGYILCTIDKDPKTPFYDHNLSQNDVIVYNSFITDLYKGNQDALRQAKELLDL